MDTSGVRGTAFIVGDGNFFPRIYITDYVNSFIFYIAIPTIISIWKTTVVYKANSRIYIIDNEVETAG